MLSQKYQQEQGELEAKIEALTAQLASTREQEDGVNKWVELIKQFSSPTELTAELLNTLIEKSLFMKPPRTQTATEPRKSKFFTALLAKLIDVFYYVTPLLRHIGPIHLKPDRAVKAVRFVSGGASGWVKNALDRFCRPCRFEL